MTGTQVRATFGEPTESEVNDGEESLHYEVDDETSGLSLYVTIDCSKEEQTCVSLNVLWLSGLNGAPRRTPLLWASSLPRSKVPVPSASLSSQ